MTAKPEQTKGGEQFMIEYAKNKAAGLRSDLSRKKQDMEKFADMLEGKELEYPVAGQVSLGRLQSFVIAFVVIGVAGTVGLNIMGSVQENINDSAASQGASQAIEGMNELLGFLPVIGLVVAAAVVIGLVSGFGSGMGRGRA
jgi:hypothetical protein